ncbi:adenylyltransferase/cytidyltransferase family protein [Streptomyces sp. NBC_01471]|uniref:adenylyltransferase/cytidyltransferase family protein n=1 Tax=Streptomyces sp. NBC_01471 TaxID=2903879 RepID=UPI003246304B
MTRVVGYASGVFDLFHLGHLNLLKRARERCDYLVAGVLIDEVALHKGYPPVVPLAERMEIVESLGCVDEVVVDTTLEKVAAWEKVGFHRMFKGDDWKGTPRGDQWERDFAALGVTVVWLPRTEGISTAHRRALVEGIAAEARE